MRIIADYCTATLSDISNTADSLKAHISELVKIANEGSYQSQTSFINLPADTGLVSLATNYLRTLNTANIKYIILCGIGGSNLGVKALYDALYGYYESQAAGRYPKMIFADTIDEELINNLNNSLLSHIEKPEDLLLFNISKSGNTLETHVNFEIIFSLLSEKFNNESVKHRTIFITDQDSPLQNAAQIQNIKFFDMPPKIGGRFSVFSNVGIVPLISAGFNVGEFISGANSARSAGLTTDLSTNPSLLSACVINWLMRTGIGIHNNFFFTPSLESLGKWYRQLVGESLGKDDKGLTPIVSIGSIDLHSMLQLYVGGPKDMFTSFIHSLKGSNVRVPNDLVLPNLGNNIAGKSMGEIMEAIYGGVIKTYKDHNLPHMEIILDGPSLEYNIGEFMMYKMIEVYLLAILIGVDPFTQPNVEGYKKATKKLLLS